MIKKCPECEGGRYLDPSHGSRKCLACDGTGVVVASPDFSGMVGGWDTGLRLPKDFDPVSWTDERPTQPGSYWLSLPPENRGTCWKKVESVTLDIAGMVAGMHYVYAHVTSRRFDGAKWSKRIVPADPFALTPT